MPFVQGPQLPGLATQIKNLTERVRALEAKRTFTVSQVSPGGTFTTTDTNSYAPAGWSLPGVPGLAGFLVVFAQVTVTVASATYVPANLFVQCNGILVFLGTGNTGAGVPVTLSGVAVFPGLTINASYPVQIFVSAAATATTYVWSAPQLVVLPF